MGRAVLANTDGIMGQHIGNRQLHEGSQAHHRLDVVGEYEEGSHIGSHAAMEGHAVADSPHSQLPDTEVHVAAVAVLLAEEILVLHLRLVGWSQVSTAAHEAWHDILQLVDDVAGQGTAGSRLLSRSPEGLILQDSLHSILGVELVVESRCCRELRLPLSEHLIPLVLCFLTFGSLGCIVGIDLLRHSKRLASPAQVLLGCLQVFLPQRLAMSTGLALLCRTAVADLGMDGNKGRTLLVSLCFLDGPADSSQISAVSHIDSLEAECLHALLHILSEGNISIALDGNVVAVIDDNQLGQAKGACQGEGLGGNTLHHAAITAQGKGIMVIHRIARLVELLSQMCLGNCHAHCHAHACPQRAGSCLNAYSVAVLRMARSQGIQLTEILQVIHGQAVAKEMQQGIQHGGAMAAGQDKAVPVQPLWIFRIVAHVLAPQLVSDWRTAHRQARMAGLRLLNHLGSQNTDSIYTGVLNITQR